MGRQWTLTVERTHVLVNVAAKAIIYLTDVVFNERKSLGGYVAITEGLNRFGPIGRHCSDYDPNYAEDKPNEQENDPESDDPATGLLAWFGETSQTAGPHEERKNRKGQEHVESSRCEVACFFEVSQVRVQHRCARLEDH